MHFVGHLGLCISVLLSESLKNKRREKRLCGLEMMASLAEGGVSPRQSSPPRSRSNKAVEGKRQLRIIPDEPARMNNYCSLTQGEEAKDWKSATLLPRNPFLSKVAPRDEAARMRRL